MGGTEDELVRMQSVVKRLTLSCLFALWMSGFTDGRMTIARAKDGHFPVSSLANIRQTGDRETVPEIAAETAQNTQPSGICPAQLGEELEAIAQRAPYKRIRWGILVQTQAQEGKPARTLYARDADHYFLPASNAKLFTTAAALQQLSPQFRIVTTLEVLPGNANETVLQLRGQGDPSLDDRALQTLAQQLQQQGIRSITRLVLDHSLFTGSSIHPNWEWEDVQAGYGAPVTSLAVNQNAVSLTLTPQSVGQPLQAEWLDPAIARGQNWTLVNQTRTVDATADEFITLERDPAQPSRLLVGGQLRVGADPDVIAVAVWDPATYFQQRFRAALKQSGITLGEVQVISAPSSSPGRAIATVSSPPLTDLITEVNRTSNNFYTEMLVHHLGVDFGKKQGSVIPQESTRSLGLRAIATALTELGVEPESYALVDGSGLSRHNLVSPTAIVQTLQGMGRSPYAQVFRNSLTVAGVNGTLGGRFVGTPVEGKLYGKTGTLTGNSALSGYLAVNPSEPLVFSILANNANQSAGTLRQGIDEMVRVFSRLRDCPAN